MLALALDGTIMKELSHKEKEKWNKYSELCEDRWVGKDVLGFAAVTMQNFVFNPVAF